MRKEVSRTSWLRLALEAALSLLGQPVETQVAVKFMDNLAVVLLYQAVINLPLGVGVALLDRILLQPVLLAQEARRFKAAPAVEQEARFRLHQLLLLEAQGGHLQELLVEGVQQVQRRQQLQVPEAMALRALVVKVVAEVAREGQLLVWVVLVVMGVNPVAVVVAVELPQQAQTQVLVALAAMACAVSILGKRQI